jgi:hypothetical protein
MPRALALLLLLIATGAHARTATLNIERASLPLGRFDTVEVKLGDDGKLALTAQALDASGLGYRFRDLRWRCDLQRESGGALRCRGPLRARDAGSATLAASWNDGRLDLAVSKGEGELGFAFADPMVLRGIAVPAAWLQPLLAARWPQARLTAGTVDTELVFGHTPAQGLTMGGPLFTTQLGLDTTDGRIAAAALDARGRVDFAFDDDATGVQLALQLQGGELLAGPFYAALPEAPIDTSLAMRSAADGAWGLQRFAWKDPGALEIEASGTLDFAAESPLAALDATVGLPALAIAVPRYLETLLGTLGFQNLALEGAATVSLRRAQRAWQHVEVDLQPTTLREARFGIEGLAGNFVWSRTAAAESALRWQSARLHDVRLGAAALPLRSEQGGIALRQSVQLDLLGGQLALSRFAWRPGTLDAGLALRNLDLRETSRALGWPEFGGTLSGELPALRYAGEVLSFDGGLRLDVFDGRVELMELTLERPFGVAPTLSARIALADLDLKPLTGAFGFGEISGRLDGRVDGLRLVDWQPVAFDADLHTEGTSKEPRRISQRAVQDLSSVGGAGVVAGLQAQVLKLFETFPYSRIGLKCRLANNVCEMAGLDSSNGGYTIVEGSGLPRITVVGHQRRVDWPVLVARLKAATEGQTPIVD